MPKKITAEAASAAGAALVRARGDRQAGGTSAQRLLAAKAAREELRLARERGELIPAADVSEAWGQLVGVCRARLLAIPAKLAPVVAMESEPRRCREVLTNEIHTALDELARTEVKAKEGQHHGN